MQPGETRETAMERYNLIVIGGGSAGLTAAGGAALLGARVALLERAAMGGECLHRGCVPSKALLHVARLVHSQRTAGAQATDGAGSPPGHDLKAALAWVRAAQARIAPHDSTERFTAMGVEVIHSHARLRSPHEVEATDTGRRLWGRHVVIATGSFPYVPDVPGLREAGYLTNESVFDLDRQPSALLVLGGGPIGCEMGQALARLGSEVTIVNRGAHLLGREDDDVSAVLERRLAAEGITIRNRSTLLAVEAAERRHRARIRTADGEVVLEVDRILVAAGRRPRVDGLGLDAAGIECDERGIRIDRTGRTSARSVWAVGDVTDSYRFTHWAGHQARLVVRNALLPGRGRDDRDTLPWATFTDPEVARLGCSETEARRRGIAYDCYRVPFDEIDRAVCDGTTDGFAKVLTRRGRGRILGASIVHPHAGELIGELALAKKHGITLASLGSLIHVYPTLGDVNRALADEYVVGRLIPRLRPFTSPLFAWMRR
jgi:pyruvate/2-oxoglutarate dehydrogenase complex dihydrolipoamide dehydrogenase (E3) component